MKYTNYMGKTLLGYSKGRPPFIKHLCLMRMTISVVTFSFSGIIRFLMNKGCSHFIALLHFYIPPGKVPPPIQPLLDSHHYHVCPLPEGKFLVTSLFTCQHYSQHSGGPAAPIQMIFVTCWFHTHELVFHLSCCLFQCPYWCFSTTLLAAFSSPLSTQS